jgi:methylated-DNA-[protein]-cysteine S-methyltransferase
MTTSPLREKVYALLLEIPRGCVTTYGEIARALDSKAYRAIGVVLNRNPKAPEVPCHRVVMSDGFLGGYAFGIQRKRELLREEGLLIDRDRIVDFAQRLHRFTQSSR